MQWKFYTIIKKEAAPIHKTKSYRTVKLTRSTATNTDINIGSKKYAERKDTPWFHL